MSSNKISMAEYKKLRGEGRKPTKYRNKQTIVDGIKFPSQKQANRFVELKLLCRAGEVLWFIREPPFDLPSERKPRKWRADFLVVWADGKITIEDTKGVRTKDYIVKRDIVEHRYGVHVTEL